MSILPQFWASDMHEMPRRLRDEIENLHFTTVLIVRHPLFALKVARKSWKFAFYHSFERPTLTFCVKGRSASLKICILPQFWASDTREVTRGSRREMKILHFTTVLKVRSARSDERVVKSKGAIPAPERKRLIGRLLLQSFFCRFSFAVFSPAIFQQSFL